MRKGPSLSVSTQGNVAGRGGGSVKRLLDTFALLCGFVGFFHGTSNKRVETLKLCCFPPAGFQGLRFS